MMHGADFRQIPWHIAATLSLAIESADVDKNAAVKKSAVTSVFLPNIAQLIADGEITVGVLRPIGCGATATRG